ncbi:MAG TPA: hypothetical protein DCE44_17775 [Verrucomicrobiales bacterium]|nr:hypothetical protein [Verrucomicrobiales bacterium]
MMVPLMCLARLREGRIVEGWNSWDVTAAVRAISESSNKK